MSDEARGQGYDITAEVCMPMPRRAGLATIADLTKQRDDALKEARNLKTALETALEQRNRHGLNAKKALAEVARLKDEVEDLGYELMEAGTR